VKTATATSVAIAATVVIVATAAARVPIVPAALVKMAEELRTANSAQNYWLGEYNKKCGTIKDLEHRINELTSPLAELARSAKE
jgi:hypothetical protein